MPATQPSKETSPGFVTSIMEMRPDQRISEQQGYRYTITGMPVRNRNCLVCYSVPDGYSS